MAREDQPEKRRLPARRSDERGGALERIDRLVLNPWVSRVGNTVFLGAVAQAIVRKALGTDAITLLTLVLLAVGVVLMAAPFVARRLRPAAPPQDTRPLSGSSAIDDWRGFLARRRLRRRTRTPLPSSSRPSPPSAEHKSAIDERIDEFTAEIQHGKPRLHVAVDPLVPAHKRLVAGYGGWGYFPEVAVTNEGNATADNVRGEVTAWKYGDRAGIFRDHTSFGHPRPLGRRRQRGDEGHKGTTLAPQESVRLSLGWTMEVFEDGEDYLHLYAYPDRGGLFDRSHPRFYPGTYRATVRVTADNAEPVEGTYELQYEAWNKLSLYPVEP